MKRIDLYTTTAEAYNAFRQFCDDHDCDANSSIYSCPYVNMKERCKLCWAMEKVDNEKN